jgi:hypothetical protein
VVLRKVFSPPWSRLTLPAALLTARLLAGVSQALASLGERITTYLHRPLLGVTAIEFRCAQESLLGIRRMFKANRRAAQGKLAEALFEGTEATRLLLLGRGPMVNEPLILMVACSVARWAAALGTVAAVRPQLHEALAVQRQLEEDWPQMAAHTARWAEQIREHVDPLEPPSGGVH